MKRNAKTGLTPAEARFIATYLSLDPPNGAEAYRRLHPAANEETCRRTAKRLLARPAVTTRVAEMQEMALRMAGCTFAQHLTDLALIRDQAVKLKEFSVAVRAEELRGRASGHYVERSRVDMGVTQELVNAINVSDLSDDELAAIRAGRITPKLLAKLRRGTNGEDPSSTH